MFSDSYGRAVPDPYDADKLTPTQRETTIRNTLFMGEPCTGDVNEDGIVSVEDLLYIIRYFGNTDGIADQNGDGVTDINDLFLVMDHFLTSCE